MKRLRFALLLIAVFAVTLSGCEKKERYAIEQGKDGRVYRLDRQTGEMAVVVGEKLIGMNTPERQKNEKQSESALAQEKNWPDENIPEPYNLNCKLKTSWREGRMYYIFSVYPMKKAPASTEGKQIETPDPVSGDWEWRDQYIGNLSNHITINMADKGGFKLAEISLPFYSLIRTVDDKGKPSHIQNEGNVPCTSDTYKDLNSWSMQWNLLKASKDVKEPSKKKRLRF